MVRPGERLDAHGDGRHRQQQEQSVRAGTGAVEQHPAERPEEDPDERDRQKGSEDEDGKPPEAASAGVGRSLREVEDRHEQHRSRRSDEPGPHLGGHAAAIRSRSRGFARSATAGRRRSGRRPGRTETAGGWRGAEPARPGGLLGVFTSLPSRMG